jgi:hypothetical protein
VIVSATAASPFKSPTSTPPRVFRFILFSLPNQHPLLCAVKDSEASVFSGKRILLPDYPVGLEGRYVNNSLLESAALRKRRNVLLRRFKEN